MFLPGGGAGGIFISDVTGDGSGDGSGVYGPTGDLVPGTKLGAYGRKIKANDLTGFIHNFNSTVAGRLLPLARYSSRTACSRWRSFSNWAA